MIRALLALACIASALGTAEAQKRGSAVLRGAVMTDVGGTPVVGAEVAIPVLGLTIVTDSSGAYSLPRVPAGSHEVQVRRLGYTLMTHTVTFADGQTSQRVFYLNRPQTLDTIVVADSRPAIISFEEHRKRGLGTFITREQLAQQDGRRMHEVLAQLPGAEIKHTGDGAFVANVRREIAISKPASKSGPGIPQRSFCYPVVYVDAMMVYRGNLTEEPFNINSVSVANVEAVEYYASAALAPMRYTPTQASCGILVIHTRRGERGPR
jgi:hypothetical protein